MRTGVSIGVVHDEKIEAGTVRALLQTRQQLTSLDQVIMVAGSVGNFDLGRNKIVQHFLTSTSSEWLLTVDSDMVWEVPMIDELISSACPVVGGLYLVNDDPPRACMVRRDELGYLKTIAHWDRDLIEVDGMGGGFTAIHYSVLEEIEHVFGDRDDRAGPWYRQSAVGASRRMLEPDHAFVQRVQQLGHKVYVNPEVLVGHVKTRVLGGPSDTSRTSGW